MGRQLTGRRASRTAGALRRGAMPVRTPASTVPAGGGGGDVIVIDGNGVIVATRGAIVSCGNAGHVVANTGSAGQNGTIRLSAPPADLPGVEVPRAPGTPMPPARGTSVLPARAGLARTVLDLLAVEDQSVVVHGHDNRVSYDDAVIVVDRDGPVNVSTGDTDSGGLNLVDTVDSVVTGGTRTVEDDEDSTGGADADEPAAMPARASAVQEDDEDLGDGTVLRSVRVDGDRNLVVNDDGVIIVGGRGRLNVQVGDADTGGLLAMRTRGSQVTAARSADGG